MTILKRSEPLDGTKLDAESYTVEAIIATDAPVIRRDGRGPFRELLDPAGLVLVDGADFPLQLDHDHRSRATVGRVSGVRVEGNKVLATLKFSNADDVAGIRQRVSGGDLRHVSSGYAVDQWAESMVAGVRTKTAVRWRLREVSITPLPADPNSQIVTRKEPIQMTPEEIAANRAEVRRICRAANMVEVDVDALVDGDATVEEAKAAAFDALQTRSTPRFRPAAVAQDGEAYVRAAIDGLLYRMGATADVGTGRDFVPMSLLGFATDSLSRSGVNVRGMSADDIIERSGAHGTSDFALVVSNVAGKSVAQKYQAAASPLKKLAQARNLSNFKASTSIGLGELGQLMPLSESGEIKSVSRAENGESIILGTFAAGLGVTRNLIINDDLGLFGDITAALGEAAAQTEAGKLVALLTAPGNLSDGVALFHADRGNIGAGVAIDDAGAEAAVKAARVTMRQTKGLDGVTIIDAAPRHLVVGPEGEDAARALVAKIFPATTADVNALEAAFDIVVEPRIAGKGWFLLADKEKAAVLRYAHMAGAPGPQIQRQEAWNTLGLSFRCYLDFGTGYAGWRGSYKG